MSRRNGAAARRGRSPIDSHSRPRLIAIRCRQSAVDGDVRTHARGAFSRFHSRADRLHTTSDRKRRKNRAVAPTCVSDAHACACKKTRARGAKGSKNIAALLYNVKVNERRAFRIVRRRNRTKDGSEKKKQKRKKEEINTVGGCTCMRRLQL